MEQKMTDAFYENVKAFQDKAFQQNRETIGLAAKAIADSIADKGMLHVFGSGHSSIVALEIIGRAGGLVPVNAIHDATGGWPEGLSGYGAALFDRYKTSYEIHPGEVVIVISNSGKNSSPVEVALGAKEAGAKVVAVTSLEMSKASTSQHASGKRLFEIADYVLDNFGIPGDASVDVPGGEMKAGSTSTLTGALLLNLLVLDTLQELHGRGCELPILKSNNLEGSKEFNDALFKKFRSRLRQPL
ncbi:MAG: sugar isomerase domain-containing protein [Chthoniobacterales bacterium]